MAYLLLGISVMLEIFGTTMLKISNGFSRPLPVLGFITGFGSALYLLAVTMQTLPLGVVYATWAGLGTMLTVIIGVLYFKDKINKQGYLGIVLLLVGITLMNLTN